MIDRKYKTNIKFDQLYRQKSARTASKSGVNQLCKMFVESQNLPSIKTSLEALKGGQMVTEGEEEQ